MSILCGLKRDNLYPVSDMSPMRGIQQTKPIASAVAVIERRPAAPVLKTLPLSPVLEIIDPKEYRIPSDIIQQILKMPQQYDTFTIGEDDCTTRFSPENKKDHALLAMHGGYAAGVLFGTVEDWSNGTRVFDVRIVCVRKQWRSREGQKDLANEQVGTKLILASVKKTLELGLDILTFMYFAPSGGNEGDMMACKRREALFQKLGRGIPSERSVEEYFDISDRYVKEVHMTYYLRTPDYTFDFDRAMSKFIRGS